jgi:spore germination protein KC
MTKYKRNTLILIVVVLSMLMSSCASSDSKDINEKRILTAVALDKKDGEIYIYVEIANVEGGGSSKSKGETGASGSKYIHVISHGKDITEARENLDREIDKQPYLSAIRTLILTERFAKEDLVEYLYRLRAEELYRKKAITVTTKEDLDELFNASNEKDVSVGFSIEEMLKTLEESGESFSRITSRYLENLSTKYTGFLIPCIGLQNKENSLIGYSVVKGTKVTDFIPVEESEGAILLKTDKPIFHYVVPYKDNKFTIMVSLKKRDIKPSYENGKISFDIKCSFDAKLMYGDKKTPYNFDDATNAKVTDTLTEMLKKQLTEAAEQAQKEYKCDYLQLYDEFRIKYPEKFEKMDWEEEFEKATVNIDVKVKLRGTWMMDYETDKNR